jgi:hypothetical protein
LDLKSFFDSLDHSLVLKAVAHHTSLRWILLYVERWLKAPLQLEDGTLKARDRGSPQGSAISPVLANIFLHYALDLWLGREFPDVPFERYADDEILHCKSKQQAQIVLDAIIARLAQVGLELNLDKTRIVYCKDSNRIGSHEHEQFTFLGYTFRPRSAWNRAGEMFVSFIPAVSDDAAKEIRRVIRRWRLHLWSGATLADIAQEINPTVRGWINYYGRFYRTELIWTLRRINRYLVRWAMRNTNGCVVTAPGRRGSWRRLPNGTPSCSPTGRSAAHARWLDERSPVSREAHAGICERRGVKLPPATRPGVSRHLLELGPPHGRLTGPGSGPRRGYHVPHARAATGMGALCTPRTAVLIPTDGDFRPAPAAWQRPVLAPDRTSHLPGSA